MLESLTLLSWLLLTLTPAVAAAAGVGYAIYWLW